MELLKAIQERRTIRRFKPDPVSRELLEQLIQGAMWAPSAMNEQPWINGKRAPNFQKPRV